MSTRTGAITKAAVIIAVLALALGAVVVVNTMAMATLEHRRRVRRPNAVGWRGAAIVRLVVCEADAVSLVGAAVGVAAGVLASELLIRALTGIAFVSPAITPWVLGRGLLVGFALGVLVSVSCVIHVRRVTARQR